MDKRKQTGLEVGVYMPCMQLLTLAIWPNLEWKTQPKLLLDFLPFNIVLPTRYLPCSKFEQKEVTLGPLYSKYDLAHSQLKMSDF
jgi:hypothetical protein